jgi:uncharacterized protein YecT (DUF1311 family)
MDPETERIMKFTTFALFALGLLLTLSQAHANPATECSYQAGSQVEIGDCLAKVTANVDAAIEQALEFANDVAKELDEITQRDVAVPALSLGQSSWAVYRDKHCDFVGSMYGGGSGTGIAIQSCRIELGRMRVEELMKYAQ